MRAETPPRRGRRDLLQGFTVWMLFLALVPSASAQPVIEVTEVPTASAAPTLAGLDPASAAGAAFAAGGEGYTDLRLTDAIAYWQEAVAQADDPQASRDLRAWLAEATRRVAQQNRDSVLQAVAVAHARRVLAEDACHSHAHLALADALNPQFFISSLASADSAWHHIQRAVGCDPDDGNAWVSAWVEAVRRGDTARADRALDELARVGFWTPPAMAFARWTLLNVPEGAVLLTNGDADTVPMRIAQAVEGLRPDVAVVNVPLLDVPEVARHVAATEGLPLPDTVEAFVARYDARGSSDSPDGRLYTLRDAVLDRWLAASADGSLGRPLVAALTLDPGLLGFKTGLVDVGAALVPSPEPGFDADAARAAFVGLDGAAFRGALVHPTDRSPVRRAFPFDPGSIVLFQMLQTAVTFAQALQPADAEAVLADAIVFAAAAGRPDDPLIATAREWLDADWGGEP